VDWYRIEQLGPGVYALIDVDGGWFRSNSGIIYNGEITILVDTQYNEPRTRALLQAVESLGLPPPRLLINTHHHGDHAFGNHLVPAPAIMHHNAAQTLEALKPLVPSLYQQFFPHLDFTGSRYTTPQLQTGDHGFQLHGPHGTITVEYHGPAHTTGDLTVTVDWAKTAFLGDLAFNRVTPLAIDGSLQAWAQVLDKLAPSLEGYKIIPGHGPPTTSQTLQLLAKYMRHVLGATRLLLQQGITDPLQIALKATPGPLQGWREEERLVLNIARAILDIQGQPPGTPLPNLPELALKMQQYAQAKNNPT